MEKFRAILKDIDILIQRHRGAHCDCRDFNLKDIWNSLSDAVTEHEKEEKVIKDLKARVIRMLDEPKTPIEDSYDEFKAVMMEIKDFRLRMEYLLRRGSNETGPR